MVFQTNIIKSHGRSFLNNHQDVNYVGIKRTSFDESAGPAEEVI
jgi:nitrous oxidase accessory protein NosD